MENHLMKNCNTSLGKPKRKTRGSGKKTPPFRPSSLSAVYDYKVYYAGLDEVPKGKAIGYGLENTPVSVSGNQLPAQCKRDVQVKQ